MKKLFIICICFLSLTSTAIAEINNPDEYLLKAAEECDHYGVLAALSQGAYINARDKDGRTPLIKAARNYSGSVSNNQRYNIINLLLSKGADSSIKDNAGKTAADYHAEDTTAAHETRIRDLLAYFHESNNQRKIIEKNFEPSYVGFLPAFIKDMDELSFPQILEAEMNIPIDLFGLNPSKNFNFFTNFVVKLEYRMLREVSSPVLTPSFMPRGNIFLWWNDLNRRLPRFVEFMYFSFMLSHHSNGQSGNFYTSEGRVNTESGNFSTNYVEPAISIITHESLWINIAYQRHITSMNWEPGLAGQYETGKVLLKVRKFFFSDSLQIFGSIAYITSGREYLQSPEPADEIHPAIAGIRARPRDNFQYQAEIHWRIPCYWRICFQEDLSFFFKYYYGYDYYNIHFQEKINSFQFGLSGYLNR